ncbi:hypothetical protein Pyn_32343 [Prunus yedoensis var. nudiflora]|uniref:Uncharacterized protein n=1 Tax=Prunus yedoensis var. nudiflora TaxID=2094558 RepID=A0A314Y7B4_PRUYE|nr:hypothetical protein Pyn_32343 [Prunus yedoensis var. nudiflora]
MTVGIGSEMAMPVREIKNRTMFPPSSFDLESFINDCKSRYGVPPRTHWITTYYGGHECLLATSFFPMDLETLTVQAGTHCLDLLRGNISDPEWLVNQRKIEVRIIKEGRIDKYSVDLQALKHEKPLQN